jgi:transposase
MTKQIEVITSVQRRRRWSRAEKERIVAAAIEPGAVASEVARAAGIHTSQLFRWRQELCRSSRSAPENAPAFSAVTIAAAPAEPATTPALSPPSASSVVEIEFASGARMRIAGAVDPSMASAMIAALTKTKRRRR